MTADTSAYISRLEQTNRVLAQMQVDASDRLQEQVAQIRRAAKADSLVEAADLIRFPEGGAHTEESLYFNSYYVNRLLSRAADIREGRA